MYERWKLFFFSEDLKVKFGLKSVRLVNKPAKKRHVKFPHKIQICGRKNWEGRGIYDVLNSLGNFLKNFFHSLE